HLGSSRACANQIFRVGRATYGFQGHIEVTPDIIRSWIRLRADTLAAQDPTLFGRIERDFERHMKDAIGLCRSLTRRWLGLVRSSGG
ncbi:MAG: type 1 glutamine amidotransferase, partial [Geminicoccaceae bacterium]|nr:type 1 glutamine amidotransferase [Geminicoccaceae bacterium]